MMYSIGEIAQLVKISPYTLRYYEKIGLIKDVGRDSNGVRVYTEKDLQNIKFIKLMKETGMELEMLKEFLEEGCIVEDVSQGKNVDNVIQKRMMILDLHIQKLKDKQQEIEDVLTFTKSKQALYETLLNE